MEFITKDSPGKWAMIPMKYQWLRDCDFKDKFPCLLTQHDNALYASTDILHFHLNVPCYVRCSISVDVFQCVLWNLAGNYFIASEIIKTYLAYLFSYLLPYFSNITSASW